MPQSYPSAQCSHCFTFIKHTRCKSPTQHEATSSQTGVVQKCQLFTQVITEAMILCKYSRCFHFGPCIICFCMQTVWSPNAMATASGHYVATTLVEILRRYFQLSGARAMQNNHLGVRLRPSSVRRRTPGGFPTATGALFSSLKALRALGVFSCKM